MRFWLEEVSSESAASALWRSKLGQWTDNFLQTPISSYRLQPPVTNRQSFCANLRSEAAKTAAHRGWTAASQKPGDDLLCDEVRRIATQIDWPCQLETNFADRNMGCRDRVVSGLNWVFGLVEEAIILEDDVLADLSFFQFCEELLIRFRHDSRVSMITGFNIVERDLGTNYSYFFSQTTHVWGWATWRESWSRYDRDLQHWPEIKASGLLREAFDQQGRSIFGPHFSTKCTAGQARTQGTTSGATYKPYQQYSVRCSARKPR